MNRQDAKVAKMCEPPRRQERQDFSRLLAELVLRTNGLDSKPAVADAAITLIEVFLAFLAPWRFRKAFLGALGVLAVQDNNEYLFQ